MSRGPVLNVGGEPARIRMPPRLFMVALAEPSDQGVVAGRSVS
jgi:hypothetical protein